MKTKWYAGLAILLCVMCLFTGAFAQDAGLDLIGMHSSTNSTTLQLGVKLFGSDGATVPADLGSLQVHAGDDRVALYPSRLNGMQRGHIIVVDTSAYYSDYVSSQNIQTILNAYLASVPNEHRVLFVLADEQDAFMTGYMTAPEARVYAQTIRLTDDSASCIYKGIRKAFEAAITPAEDAPAFNSIFIVADPEQTRSKNDTHSLGESEMLRNFSARHPEVLMTIPLRQKYLDQIGASRRETFQQNVEILRGFCRSVGGTFVETPQSGNDVDVAPLQTAVSGWLDAAMYFELDYSQLSGHVSANNGMQNVPLYMNYDDGRKYVETFFTAEVNTNLLTGAPVPVTQPPVTAPPTATPAPMITPTPTPTPTPTLGGTVSPKPQEPTAPPPTAVPPTAVPPTAAPTAEPGLFNLQIQIGPVAVKLWMLAAGILGVSVLAVVIGIIAAVGRRKKQMAYVGEHSPSPSFQQLGMETNAGFTSEIVGAQNVEATIAKNYGTESVNNVEATVAKNYGTESVTNVEATLPKNYDQTGPVADVEETLPRNYDLPAGEDCEPTQQPYSTTPITIEVIYNGQRREEKAELMEDQPFLIGRKDNKLATQVCDLVLDNGDKFISRKQARLIIKEGKFYLLDLSTYGNTLVNDQKIPHEKENADGLQLSSGDSIKMSSHTITIKW